MSRFTFNSRVATVAVSALFVHGNCSPRELKVSSFRAFIFGLILNVVIQERSCILRGCTEKEHNVKIL